MMQKYTYAWSHSKINCINCSAKVFSSNNFYTHGVTMNLLKKAFVYLTVLSLAAGCLPKKKDGTPGYGSSSSGASGGEIRIGAVFPMTGPIATYGQESMNGINLALKSINTRRIGGKSIRLILEDNKGEPSESANAVRKLINVDKVHMVLGSVASSNTLAGAPIAQAAKVPMLTPASTNEAVTKKGDYILRTCFSDAFQGVVLAKFARETLRKKNAVIIIDVASDYSRGLAEVFKTKFESMGGKVLPGQYTYNQGDKDFRSLIRRVKRAVPDVIFLPGYYTEVGVFLKQARQMGVSTPVLGGDGWDSPKLQELAGRKGIIGNYISSHFAADDNDPVVKGFVSDYKNAYAGQVPGAMAALGYDALLVIANALEKTASDLSHKSIRDALAATKDFPGVSGKITIEPDRNAKKSAVILETTSRGMQFKQRVDP